MAHNLVADRRRGGEAERRVLQALYEGDGCRHSNHLGATPEPSPESRAMARQRLGFFLERCRKAAYVGPRHQMQLALKLRVIRLAFLDGCSSREIARVLCGRMTPRQIDALVFRLRQRLARLGVEVARRRGHGFPDPLTSAESFVHR
jgi:DNA-directed RNA polymerase specialized sigma24 family protein